MTPALDVRGLYKNYGEIAVLRDVSFTLPDKATLAIIGPNGAGKTTMFKALTGEAMPNQGQIHAHGVDITYAPIEARVRLGFGRTFQVARIFQESTLAENLIVAIEARRRSRGESIGAWNAFRPLAEVVAEADRALDSVGLLERRRMEARFLSHGDKKRLEIAITLALEPRVLMLDEPTAGMSPSDRRLTVELIMRIREMRGLTVMLTEHDMDVVFGLADQIMVLNYGQVIAIGAGKDIRDNPAVREVYLGQEAHDA
jgi:branched-chain amino acid transport system ATP-binding protein